MMYKALLEYLGNNRLNFIPMNSNTHKLNEKVNEFLLSAADGCIQVKNDNS